MLFEEMKRHLILSENLKRSQSRKKKKNSLDMYREESMEIRRIEEDVRTVYCINE